MSRRRGFVLVAVLIVVGAAMLVATGALSTATADAAGADAARRATRGRALSLSALRAIADRLDRQRDALLAGEAPTLDEVLVLYESGGLAGVARLLPVGPDGAVLVAEASKLDLNRVDAAMLVATGLVTEPVAAAIIARRSELGAFASVGELLTVPGLDAATLYGPLEEIEPMDDARGRERGLGERIADRLVGPEPRGLADLLTVHAHEPALQRSGVRRLDLATPWSEELGARLDERFGEGAGALVKGIIDQGTRFDSDAAIFRVMVDSSLEPEEWSDVLDGLTAEGAVLVGRLDVNRAPYEALAALPGIEPDQAARLVDAREALDAERRATIAWPLLEEILAPEDYLELGTWLTVRSWTWRLRLAIGETDAADPEGAIAHPIILDVVVDLTEPTARIAELRDVTLLQIAARLALEAPVGDEEEIEDDALDAPVGAADDGAGDEPADDDEADAPPSDEPAPIPFGSDGTSGDPRDDEAGPPGIPRDDDVASPLPDPGRSSPASSAPRRAPIGRWRPFGGGR